MKKSLLINIAVTILLFSSCASIVSESNWPLRVTSNPAGATITISNRRGAQVYVGTTPATVKLKSSAGFFRKESYKIKFELSGYDLKVIPVECKVNGWYWGNLLFGGVLGFLIIDPATGAMYKLDKEFVSETLTKTTGSIDNCHELKVYGINDIPQNLKHHLIRIN